VLLCAAGATPALAAAKHRPKPVYRSGAYTGSVTQLLPSAVTGRLPSTVTGQLSFDASPGALSAINVKVAELCGTLLWVVLGDAPTGVRVSVARNGSFFYDRTAAGDHLSIKGRIHGSLATGTLFESLTSGGLACTMVHPGTFSVKR